MILSVPCSAPKSLGLDVADQLPIVRLSFHGNNHYNSVVDSKHPPPLGDGMDVSFCNY